MNWQLIKTNWFSIAVVLLLLAAILRTKGFFHASPSSGPSMGSIVAGLRNSETALGLAMEPERHVVPKETDRATSEAFLKRFARVAVSEKKKFGIPASILLATAFINSNAGQGAAAEQANNFFSVGCSEDWEGETVSVGSRCYRKYETPWASWRDFSIFLTGQSWFGALKKDAGKDWSKWVQGINAADVSNVGHFNDRIREVIEQFRLYELDQNKMELD